ncbi:hypothetical protein NoPa_00155 [Pseudomonas phage vB_PpuM-NoPa]|uniref:Uncharacterized protein n=2 Tax=Tartuvirus TaxID=3424912 RepID=A0AAX4MY22_9CAUD
MTQEAEHTYYNKALADKLNLSEETREELTAVYGHLYDALYNPDNYDDVTTYVTDLEYTLQGLWGFPKDKKFHYYNLHIKGCRCPELDNMEMVGHSTRRFVSVSCPIHKGVAW